MNNDYWLSRLVTIIVIFLFIVLAIAPSIHANISKSVMVSNQIEITTKICGIRGIKPHTVKLSQEEADELDALFDSIEVRLNGVKTRDEAVEIFNDAIIEFDNYGLLGDLSVKQVQKLVTGRFQNSRLIIPLERIYRKIHGPLDVEENLNCLVAGNTNNTAIMSILFPPFLFLFPKFEKLLRFIIIFDQIRPLFLLPVTLIEIIEGTGWVFTIGMNGTKY